MKEKTLRIIVIVSAILTIIAQSITLFIKRHASEHYMIAAVVSFLIIVVYAVTYASYITKYRRGQE